jgi:hypothetical protein
MSAPQCCICKQKAAAGGARIPGGSRGGSAPEEILYIPTLNSINDAASAKLAAFFGSSFDAKKMPDLFGEAVICGPLLWSSVKGYPSMQLVKGDVIDFMPWFASGGGTGGPAVLEGKVIRGKGSIEIFLRVLFDTLPANDGKTIRKLSPAEIRIYASMVPYVIREPVFIVVKGGSRLLVNFTQGLKVGFMEDMGGIEASAGIFADP